MSPAEFDAWLLNAGRRPLVMGILNVTPDSFSDGGRFTSVEAAVTHAEAMVAGGAEIIDIGGESTRPGSQRVDPLEQIRRIGPVLEALRHRRHRLPAVLSVDTTSSKVAEHALDNGMDLVNDISAGRDDPRLFEVVARFNVPMVLMHMQGTPATMQAAPTYSDVTAEVGQFLRGQLGLAKAAGVDPDKVLFDPGLGFGKTVEHNLTLLNRTRDLAALGRPLVVGSSRKGFIGKVLGDPNADRRFGTAATVAWAVANGAAVVRVHEVEEAAQVVRMTRAIAGAGTGPISAP